MIIVLFPLISFSQWIMYYENSPSSFTKICAVNKDTAIAVGLNGNIVRTTNGGVTWEVIQSGTTQDLKDVRFAGPAVAYVCGNSGTLLKSTDAGSTWIPCTTGTALHLRSLNFRDPAKGWIAGSDQPDLMEADSGIILKTTDGGVSFITDTLLNTGVVAIGSFNADTVLAFCHKLSEYASDVIRSRNGGLTWELMEHITLNRGYDVMETFPDGLTYALGGWEITKILDYGSTYTSPVSLLIPSLDISFPSQQTGYALGWDPMPTWGMIEKTVDGAQTWASQETGLFTGIDFVNDTVGYAVTFDGKIYKTENGGELVGIREPGDERGQSFSLSPNPFSTFISVTATGIRDRLAGQSRTCELYSPTGQLIRKQPFQNGNLEITDLASLPAGIYNCIITKNSAVVFASKAVKLR